MKHIRTKDGQIRSFDDYCDIGYIYLSINGIKIADTIEELCDEYVINKSVCSKKDWEMKTEELKKYILETRIVYGAIWTDKGLIYAAKMKSVLPNGEIDWGLL